MRSPVLLLLGIAAAATLSGCGRAGVSGLGNGGNGGNGNGGDGGGGGGGGPTDGSRRDANIARPDTGIHRRDGAVVIEIDAGLPPGTCFDEGDCWREMGDPICADGAPGRWFCQRECPGPNCLGKCALLCEEPPPPVCRTDCDCPFEQSCLGGSCVFANRPNQCCFNPFCPPGSFCVNPDGRQGTCPGGADGGVPPDAGPNPNRCRTDCDCDLSLSCQRSFCMPSMRRNLCCTNPICPPGEFCVEPGGGRSMCPGPNPTVQVGTACMGSCGPAGFCIDESQGFPGGYCSQDCSGGRMCPGDAVCRDTGGMSFICLDGCTSNTDCRAGYECLSVGIGPGQVCWPVPPESMNPRGLPVGSACMVEQDCASGLSCFEPDGGGSWQDGYCTRVYCDAMTRTCPGGSLCYAFPALFSMCLNECPQGGTQSTCRQGYYCLGPTGRPGVCISN